MDDEYRTVLTDIVQDPTLPGRLGRSVLAGQFAFLLAADERMDEGERDPASSEIVTISLIFKRPGMAI